MSTMQGLLLALGVSGFVFFVIRWLQLRSGYSSMSKVEQRYIEITAAQDIKNRKANRPIPKARAALAKAGLGDDLFPLFAIIAFGYISVAVALRAAGMDEIPSILVALPASIGLAWFINNWAARRRRARFNEEMITLLEMVTGQVKGGTGAERALMLVVPALPQPIKEEMTAALNASAGGGDILDALRELRERYPSRAFDMFLSALEIDRAEGHTIAPALMQASDLLRKSFALQSEAKAEIASTRWEFYGVSMILVALSARLILGSDESAKAAYTNPVGFVILAAALANTALGFWRFNRLLNNIKEETE